MSRHTGFACAGLATLLGGGPGSNLPCHTPPNKLHTITVCCLPPTSQVSAVVEVGTSPVVPRPAATAGWQPGQRIPYARWNPNVKPGTAAETSMPGAAWKPLLQVGSGSVDGVGGWGRGGWVQWCVGWWDWQVRAARCR